MPSWSLMNASRPPTSIGLANCPGKLASSRRNRGAGSAEGGSLVEARDSYAAANLQAARIIAADPQRYPGAIQEWARLLLRGQAGGQNIS